MLVQIVRPFMLNAVDGTWGACDDPWGCYVADRAPLYGEPKELQRGKEYIGHSGTKWEPVDWNSWENYNAHGVPQGKEYIGHSGTKWEPVDWNSWENYNAHGVPQGKEYIGHSGT
eukprot:CAMPEP_0172024084 /NCGR_PEP_ID=MMETSP1041-20130122/15148_1 /TAXON_ID=464988 /ORGANISM="Hemiselmis andersenii, Strain CCMP439" /LENGTH=114 /DNA_ID=CAMNT_0012679635 /DNA_START=227 /DNA_END=568 /DNA_ORIENTATION=-